MIYEVKVKMHIEAESPERATELGILFMHPSAERMKKYSIRCWIRYYYTELCMKSKEHNFWNSDCPYGQEEENGKEGNHPDSGKEDEGDIPI